ncbi:right-handed parallel beta-helix repeat-containing protein [Candidatus Micrarchaeota archaeon]|nr:right-handed parallel beta-helix repeat-containing protein [Candidatus Micrarchaeota archaeon]
MNKIVIVFALMVLASFSFAANVSTCQVITSPDTYDQTVDLTGAPNNAAPIVGTTCILINSSDVIYDCHNYDITNNGTVGTTHGIVSNGPLTNVTIRNCDGISQFTRGIYVRRTNNSYVHDNVLFDSSAHHGLIVDESFYGRFEDNTAYDNALYGIYSTNSDYNNFTRNNASLNGGRGFYIQNSENNRFIDNIADNNVVDGYRVTTSLNNVFINSNASGPNQDFGYHLDGGSGHSITGSTALLNDIGFYADNSDYNDFINVNGSLGDDGIRFESSIWNVADLSYFCDNNANGVYLLDSHASTVSDTTSCRNGRNGFNLEDSNNNDFINVNGSGNSINGINAVDSSGNEIDPSYFCDNGENGIYFNNSDNTLIQDSFVCNNTEDGMHISYSDTVTITNNTAYDNGEAGIETEEIPSGLSVTDNTAYGNVDNGIHLFNFFYNTAPATITGNTVYGNSFNGFEFSVLRDSIISDNLAYANRYNGFRWAITHNNTWSNNTAHSSNESSGFFGSNADGNNFTGLTAYGNYEHGFRFVAGADSNNLLDSVFYDNTEAGVYVLDSTLNTITNVQLYGNTPDLWIRGTGIDVTLSNVIFDLDGTFTNYTNLSLTDNVASAYTIDHTTEAVSGPPPPVSRSFAGKFINITETEPTVSIDSLVFHWTEAELAPDYLEDGFRLMRYNGSWIIVNNTADATANEFSLASVDLFGIFAIIEYPPEDGGNNGGSGGDSMSVSFSTSCEENIVKVSSGGALAGAEVKVFDKNTLSDVASGSTNSSGEFGFMGCGTDVKIIVTKSGYSTETVYKSLVACSGCALECLVDEDCAANEKCHTNMCISIDCSCGTIVDHSCNAYSCCQDSHCEANQACVNNECVDQYECTSDEDCESTESCEIEEGTEGGSCEEITGECGEAKDHAWVSYECGSEENCPDCSSGYYCDVHVCKSDRNLNGPDSGYVGENVSITATEAGGACIDCEVQIKFPDGKTITGRTDSKGNMQLPLSIEGPHEVTLLKDGNALVTIKIDALTRSIEPVEEPETSVLDDVGALFFWMVILAVIVFAFVIYRRGKTK